MASQYSHKQFFRRMPNKQLAEYFDSKDIDLGLEFEKLKEKDSEIIFEAFLTLSEEQQNSSEADFQNINAIACEGGIHALVDEASFHQDDSFTEEISAIDGFHAKAMWAFFEKHDYWRGASLFFHADNVSASFWKKRNDLPSALPHVEPDDINKLAKSISDYFYAKEGRGKNCKVEFCICQRSCNSCHFSNTAFSNTKVMLLKMLLKN